MDSHLIVAVDTEGIPSNPYSLQFSVRPGEAHMILATDTVGLAHFREWLYRVRPKLAIHGLLYDAAMLRQMGINAFDFELDDSQTAGYLLQLEPIGLKAACLRHCGMAMSSYLDILGDKANDLARQYLTWLWDSEQVEWEQRCAKEFTRLTTTPYTDARGKVQPGRRLKVHPKLPTSPLHKAVQRCLQSKRPRRLWEDQVEDIQVAGYRRLGAVPEATLDYVPRATAVAYGCRDADGTTRLRREYSQRIDALGLRDVYDLELSTYPLLDRMQQTGIKPDLKHFANLSWTLQHEVNRLQAELDAVTGRAAFNANSGDQVADYVFGTLGLEEMKMTKGGRGSTNDKILEALEREHPDLPQIKTIRSYREFYKLKNTFVDCLPDFVHRWPHDGRVHCTIRATRVVTGRLAAADPNMLAQPEHGDWAGEFKRGWVAEDGHVLWAGDESQIELRGLAHLSQDPVMCGVFRGTLRNADGSPVDLHAALAERIFGVKPKDQDKSRHRLPAKAINFGIPMGMTCKGLSVELRKNGVEADEDTAQRWLDDTLGLYTGVARYMEERKAEARRNGYVRCLSGRIRYIGGIRSRNERTREEAERFAFSTPIQESATFIMKQAEATVWNDVLPYFWKRGEYVEPLLQVHDCLKLEVQDTTRKHGNVVMAIDKAMKQAMTVVPKSFSVPLAVESEYGYNMADVEKIK